MAFSAFSRGIPQDVSLEEKIEMLRKERQAAGEDLKVYNFDDMDVETYDGLGDTLDESANDLNDETFGDVGDLGQDFDFSGGTGNAPQSNDFVHRELPKPGRPQQQPSNAWARPKVPSLDQGIDSLDFDPLLGPQTSSNNFSIPPPPESKLSQQSRQQQQQQYQQPQQPSKPKALTLDEIEAELHVQRQNQQQIQQQQQPMPPPASQAAANKPSSKALTLEELEAQIIPQQQQQQQQQPQQQIPLQQPPPVQPSPNYQNRMPPFSQGPPPGMSMTPPNVPRTGPSRQYSPAHHHPPPPPGMLQQMPPHHAHPSHGPPSAPSTPQQQMQQNRHQQQQQGPQTPGSTSSTNNYAAQSMVSAYYPPLPTSDSPSIPPPMPFISTQQRLINMRHEAEQLRQVNGPQAQEQLSFLLSQIQDLERQEERKRRKGKKIVEMAKYNGLMSQSDKDFITRIQVSQLVKSASPDRPYDPYADDFYYHVYSALKASRGPGGSAAAALALRANDGNSDGTTKNAGNDRGNRVNKGHRHGVSVDASSNPDTNEGGGDDTIVKPDRRLTRRENAMVRMAQQVQRIVDDAKKRQGPTSVTIEGALGRKFTRIGSTPRQMIQVDNSKSKDLSSSPGGTSAFDNHPAAATSTSSPSGTSPAPSSHHHHHSLSESLPLPKDAANSTGKPFTKHEALMQIEHIYDIVLEIEQLRRTQPQLPPAPGPDTTTSPQDLEKSRLEAQKEIDEWNAEFKSKLNALWESTKFNVPLDYSNPHPFISVLSTAKGKKLLPRVLRHADSQITLTILTLLLATFNTLDVVQNAPLLDSNPLPATRAYVDRQKIESETDIFLKFTVPVLMSTIGSTQLKIVSGMIGLIMKRMDAVFMARSRPGVALLTVLLTRGETLKQTQGVDAPSPEDLMQWNQVYQSLFATLQGNLVSLFPSTRAQPRQDTGQVRTGLDQEDGPVWQFLAALAVSGGSNEQQALVTEVRGKVLNEVNSARLPNVSSESSNAKLANVNFLLQSLGLDASLIT